MNASQQQELDDYHFKFKISIVGDSGVGKTTFLDAISSTLGSVVENEQSSELHIKVRLSIILITETRLLSTLMMHTNIR